MENNTVLKPTTAISLVNNIYSTVFSSQVFKRMHPNQILSETDVAQRWFHNMASRTHHLNCDNTKFQDCRPRRLSIAIKASDIFDEKLALKKPVENKGFWDLQVLFQGQKAERTG